MELTERFLCDGDEYLLDLIFSNERSGGGDINRLEYIPEGSKAIITYKSENDAKRVLDQKEIVYNDYKFKIKPVDIELVDTPQHLKSTANILKVDPNSRAHEETLMQTISTVSPGLF